MRPGLQAKLRSGVAPSPEGRPDPHKFLYSWKLSLESYFPARASGASRREADGFPGLILSPGRRSHSKISFRIDCAVPSTHEETRHPHHGPRRSHWPLFSHRFFPPSPRRGNPGSSMGTTVRERTSRRSRQRLGLHAARRILVRTAPTSRISSSTRESRSSGGTRRPTR